MKRSLHTALNPKRPTAAELKAQRQAKWKEDFARHMRWLENHADPEKRWAYICNNIDVKMIDRIQERCHEQRISIKKWKPEPQPPAWDGPKGDSANAE